MFLGCSTPRSFYKAFNNKDLTMQERHLQNKTNRAIRKALQESDTLYLYGVTFNEWEVLWYLNRDSIHSCIIYPNRIKWQNPVKANNIVVDSVSINKTFLTVFYKDILCFEDELDGEYVYLITDKDVLFTSVNLHCLFSHEYPIGSFAYKLQYDLSRVFMLNDSTKMETSISP